MKFAIQCRMRQSPLNSLMLTLVILYSSLVFSQTETIFSSKEILKIRIEGAWANLLKRRFLTPEEAKRERIPVNVVILNSDKTETVIAAEVGLRGNTSLSPLECAFPKFSLYFSEEQVSGTLLVGREQLAVGSHCSYRGGNSALYGRSYDGKSPMREALVYRLLEILEIPSFKTRPVLAQYVDTTVDASPVNVGWHQAFILESLKQFSERMGYDLVDEESAHQIDLGEVGLTDLQKLTRILLFNEMIENNDWKLNYHELPGLRMTWNMFLAKNLTSYNIEVIPNDFDLSSAVTLLPGSATAPVDALRKMPPTELKIAQDFYRSKRTLLLEELKTLSKLDPAGYQHIKKKLDHFFNSKIKP